MMRGNRGVCFVRKLFWSVKKCLTEKKIKTVLHNQNTRCSVPDVWKIIRTYLKNNEPNRKFTNTKHAIFVVIVFNKVYVTKYFAVLLIKNKKVIWKIACSFSYSNRTTQMNLSSIKCDEKVVPFLVLFLPVPQSIKKPA